MSSRAPRDRPVEPVQAVVRTSVVGRVVERLKNQIASGELQPGDRLPSQRALGALLGVSVPTVREAIGSLTNMGLLEARHGSGTYVTSLRSSEVMDSWVFALSLRGRSLAELFDIRLMLEPLVARAAAERRTAEDKQALAACIERSRAAGKSAQALLELDVELHDLVVRAAHNELLVDVMGTIAALGSDSRSVTIALPGVARDTIRDHERIVAAIAGGRLAASERAMRDHIVRVRDLAAAAGLPSMLDVRQATN